MAIQKFTRNEIQRFFKQVSFPDDRPQKFWTTACWQFAGASGRFSVNGKTMPARHFAYSLRYGSIPFGAYLEPRCPEEDPRCINPHHYALMDSVETRIEERIYRNNRNADACTWWRGSKDRDGYAIIMHEGKPRRVHRLVMERAIGTLPPGAIVMHLKDNPECCNLRHLKVGTQAENLADMRRKKRGWWQK